MSRRIYAVFVIMLAVSSYSRAWADESGSSNTVGFWKLDVHRGFTHVSFPLLPTDKSINNVLAGQLTGGPTASQSDQVLRWNHSTNQFEMIWFNTSTLTWQGDFTTFSEAQSYWIYVQPTHPLTQTLVTFGNVVETAAFTMGSMTPGYNSVGSVWAEPVPLSQAGLSGFAGGNYLFQSDMLMSYDALTGLFSYAWKNLAGLWQGNLTQLEPLKGYWLYIAPGHAGFNWNSYPQPVMGPADFFRPPTPMDSDQFAPGISAPIPLIPAPAGESITTPVISGGEQ